MKYCNDGREIDRSAKLADRHSTTLREQQMVSPRLSSILRANGVVSASVEGDIGLARSRADLSRELGERLDSLFQLRRDLADGRCAEQMGLAELGLSRLLQRAGILAPARSNPGLLAPRDLAAGHYLDGRWLEELALLALCEAGLDEVHGGVVLDWEHDGVPGRNEVDVLGLSCGKPVFVSCKAIRTRVAGDPAGVERLKSYMLEAAYWGTHFAGGQSRSILVVAADLFDEGEGRRRHPTLYARASKIDVEIVSGDELSWDPLVGRMKAILSELS